MNSMKASNANRRERKCYESEEKDKTNDDAPVKRITPEEEFQTWKNKFVTEYTPQDYRKDLEQFASADFDPLSSLRIQADASNIFRERSGDFLRIVPKAELQPEVETKSKTYGSKFDKVKNANSFEELYNAFLAA